MTNPNETKFTLENIRSVYSGKPGCCCGCLGKHYYASKHVAEASKDRGYEVTPDEVSDKMIKKVFNLISAVPSEQRDWDGSYVAIDTGSRTYIAYFCKPVQA